MPSGARIWTPRVRASGPGASASCLAGGLAAPAYDDTRADPPSGDGYFYLARGRNSCASGPFGAAPQSIDALACSR